MRLVEKSAIWKTASIVSYGKYSIGSIIMYQAKLLVRSIIIGTIKFSLNLWSQYCCYAIFRTIIFYNKNIQNRLIFYLCQKFAILFWTRMKWAINNSFLLIILFWIYTHSVECKAESLNFQPYFEFHMLHFNVHMRIFPKDFIRTWQMSRFRNFNIPKAVNPQTYFNTT